MLLPAIAAAQSSQSSEYQVKAALLLNFAKFVEWPDGSFDDPRAPIVFGIIGDDHGLAFRLRRIASGEKIQGRNVVIRVARFSDDLRRCQVLFVGTSERRHTAQVLAGLQSAGVLTVSDIDGFADAGGVVEIFMEQRRARFAVNLDAAMLSKLRVSAKLLALAHVVNSQPGRAVK
jgi:hypothetical protein